MQVEFPWALGPADGRYVLRDGPGTAGIDHVVMITTLGAARRDLTARMRRGTRAGAEPAPAPVSTGRATVVAARAPLPDDAAAQEWLSQAGDAELDEALRVLARLLHAHRLATADPSPGAAPRSRLIAARAGWGDGDAVAAGRWSQVRDLGADEGARGPRGPRRRGSMAEGRLAALLAGRQAPLACEELVLRARSDLDEDRPREAALQLLVALDAALAELPGDPGSAALAERVAELRERRRAVGEAAQEALAATPSPAARALVADTVARLQATLRARAATVA